MQLSPSEFANLSALMLSTDDANTQIALTILAAQELDDEIRQLLTEIFVVYKMSGKNDAQQQAADILNRFGSAALKTRMSRKFELGEGTAVESTIATNIRKYTAGTELDPLKFAQALYNKYGTGLVYLLEHLQGDAMRQFLKQFTFGSRFALTNKQITSLPKEFYELTHLTEIDLSGNALGTVYKEFKAFTELRVLRVSANKIKSLPKDIAKLSQLEVFDLSHNHFKNFPEVLTQLPRLRELNIAGFSSWNNKVERIPEAFFAVKTLQKLTVGGPIPYNPDDYQIHRFVNYPLFYTVEVANADEYLDLNPMAVAIKAFREHKQAVGFLLKHGDSAIIHEVIAAFYDKQTKMLDLNHHCVIHLPKELLEWDIRALNLEGARIGYTGCWCDGNLDALFKDMGAYLPHLEELNITNNALNTRAAIEPLFQLKNLRNIKCAAYLKSSVFAPMVAKIQEALPDCVIG